MIEKFLAELGLAVEAAGVTAVEDDVAVVVAAARSTGANAALTDVLADRRAPAAARERALGRLALGLAQRFEAGPTASTAIAVDAVSPARPTLRPVRC